MPRIQAGSITLRYDTYGSGEPLLLIMGFGMPGMAWMPFLPLLSSFGCIYYDNRGTGTSDRPEGIYTVPDMAEDASGLLAALHIPQARVYGISMGGMIAQELALRHPEQVSRLVLGCTMAGGLGAFPPHEDTIEALVASTKLMGADPSAALDQMLPLMYPKEFLAAHPETKQLAQIVSAAMPPTPPETVDRTLQGIAQFDASDRLPAITCPVLIVHGELDLLIPSQNAHILKQKLPQADLLMLSGVGHAFWATDPVGVYRRIVDWLKG